MKSSFMEWDPHKDIFLLQTLWADVIPDTYGTFALQNIGNPVFFSTHRRSCHAVCLPPTAPCIIPLISGAAVAVKSKFILI